MSKPKAPKPPDYAAAAEAQGEANLNSALGTNYLNQVNQVTPQGTLTYSYGEEPSGGGSVWNPVTGRMEYTAPSGGEGHYVDGKWIPQVTVTTELSPEQQALYDKNTAISNALLDIGKSGLDYVENTAFNNLDTSGAPPLQSSVDNPRLKRYLDLQGIEALPTSDQFNTQRDQITDAYMARLQPYIDADRNRLDTKLAAQGINMGNEAYNFDQNNFQRGVNDQRIAALLAGDQEAQRLFNNAFALHQQGYSDAQQRLDAYNKATSQNFGQGLAAGQFGNQARSQAIQEADYLRNAPINIVNALRTGNQVQMPQFGSWAGGAQIAPPPIYQATADQYNAALQRYNTQMAGYSGLLGGFADLGGAAIGAWA